jgi:hypothetical protein
MPFTFNRLDFDLPSPLKHKTLDNREDTVRPAPDNEVFKSRRVKQGQ